MRNYELTDFDLHNLLTYENEKQIFATYSMVLKYFKELCALLVTVVLFCSELSCFE